MKTLLIDIVLDNWKRQDEARVDRWAFFLCSKNKLPFYRKGTKFGDGHNSATTDEFIAREMFGTTTIDSNYIGVAGGIKSGGIFAFDIDIKKENTPESLKNTDNAERAIYTNFGELPKTETQITVSGGCHKLYYDTRINNLNNALDFDETGLSVDIKGSGGYFVLYNYDINFEEISKGPEWIYEHLKNRKQIEKENPVDFSDILTEGNRNSGLTSIAGRFYNYGDSIDVLNSFLHGHNKLRCKPPLPDKEVDRIIKSVVDNFKRDWEKTDLSGLDNDEDDFTCLADFLIPIEPEVFVLQDMITEGSLTIFTGTSGSGKTWVASDLCLSIVQGLDWLGKQTKQKNVFILDEESGKKRLIRRFRKLAVARGLMNLNGESKGSENIPIRARTYRRTDISSKNFVSEMRLKIIKDGIGFILIDALVDVTPGKNENDAKEMLPALLNLKQLCEETEVTIVVIHHAGKSEGSNSRGTSAIEGAIDAMFKITQDEKTGKLKIESKKERDIRKIKFGAIMKFSDYSVSIETSNLKEDSECSFTREEKFILKFLKEKGKSLKADIEMNGEKKGFRAGTIKKYIYELTRREYLECTGHLGKNAIYNINEKKKIDVDIVLENGVEIGNLDESSH
jgi:RecA-family ATPase